MIEVPSHGPGVVREELAELKQATGLETAFASAGRVYQGCSRDCSGAIWTLREFARIYALLLGEHWRYQCQRGRVTCS